MLEAEIHAKANAARSEAAKERERNADGTLASAATVSGTTGPDPNRTSTAKAQHAKVNRGAGNLSQNSGTSQCHDLPPSSKFGSVAACD